MAPAHGSGGTSTRVVGRRPLMGRLAGIDEYWSSSPAEINKARLPLIAALVPF